MKNSIEPIHNNLGFRKLPAKYNGIVMPLLLSIFMTFVVSFISTLRSIGMSDKLAIIWLGAWGISWIIAFPTLLMVLPVVRKITQFFVMKP